MNRHCIYIYIYIISGNNISQVHISLHHLMDYLRHHAFGPSSSTAKDPRKMARPDTVYLVGGFNPSEKY